MYQKDSKGWIKHGDFMLLDLICLQVAFLIAYWLRMGFSNPYETIIYRRMGIYIELMDILVLFVYGTMQDVLKRGYYKEFVKTVKHTVFLFFFMLFYLFCIKSTHYYSRLVLFMTIAIYFVLSYVVRILWKKHLFRRKSAEKCRLLVVTTKDRAEEVVRTLQETDHSARQISGLAIVDQDLSGEAICSIPVVANAETVSTYVCREWVDEILLIPSPSYDLPEDLVDELMETGVVLHMNLNFGSVDYGQKQLVEKIGDYTVLTSSMNVMSLGQAVAKRALDIVGGIVGCIITGILYLFIAPAIRKKSPGPVFFKQKRVGKNGKEFTMYKFRSMYLDAEERKSSLMEENRVQDGMMFKMEFDPRIIGNEILPDGTRKTGIGEFIRRKSLDEFPQFFNVLKGDMSLVGTRPPTLDEWNKYKLHHRARLSIKPGITGMWQVSGRSEITDFEQVVKLDTYYINNWSMGLDIKILLKTVKNVFKGKGAM